MISLSRIASDAGYIYPEAIRQALIAGKTSLIALTHASNVLGTVQPIEAIAAIARKPGCCSSSTRPSRRCGADRSQSDPNRHAGFSGP